MAKCRHCGSPISGSSGDHSTGICGEHAAVSNLPPADTENTPLIEQEHEASTSLREQAAGGFVGRLLGTLAGGLLLGTLVGGLSGAAIAAYLIDHNPPPPLEDGNIIGALLRPIFAPFFIFIIYLFFIGVGAIAGAFGGSTAGVVVTLKKVKIAPAHSRRPQTGVSSEGLQTKLAVGSMSSSSERHQPTTQPDTITCLECGTEMLGAAVRCPKCGWTYML
jgi:predicted lipid-binding transport protein (Tim44 family)